MIEGGSRVISSFLTLGSNAVDLLVVTVAPMFVGINGVKANDGNSITIQTLALILGNKPRSKREYGHGTLIVCPVSLLRQWQKEIETKTKGLTVYIHHGPKRTKSKYELLEYDIVLTSYAIVTNERGKPATWDPVTNELYEPEVKAGPIFRARWHRVILDEAHYIKNKNAASSLACADLKANKRFCLTGTPIQNSADEMYSLFRFLRVPHFCEYAYFNEKIGRHIKMGKNDSKQTLMGMTRLQCALKPYLLRRTKKSKKKDGTSILVLPKRGVEIVEVEFSEAERGFYDALSSYAESKFNKYLEQGKDFAKGEGLDGGLHRIMGGGGGRNGTNGTKSRKRRQSNAVDSRGNEDVKRSSLGIVKDTDAALFESSDEEENRSDYHKCGGSSISMAGSKRKAPSGMKESPHAKKLRLAKTVMTSAVFERVMKEVNLKDGGILETECPHCLDVLTDAMITSCGHAFCRECITGYLSHKPANEQHDDDEENIVRPCPVCRGNISSKSLVGAHCFMNDEESDDEDSDNEEKEVSDKEEDEPEIQEVGLGDILVACHEAKGARSIPNEVEPVLKKTMTPEEGKQLMIKSMISILREIDDEDPSLKVIIFSQFTSMLDLVEKGLKANGMSSFKRYDGKMSTSDRADAIEAFFSQDDIPLMLVSLKAGSVGLNLTCACRVIMLDVWWNPAVEDQAIDRVHRIGQTRDVKVFRLIIKNSFEERILTLQENKRAIAAGALGEGELRVGKLSLQDLRFLFTNDQAFLAPVAAAVAAAQAADLVKDDNDGDVGEAQVDSAP
ncbi:DNA helicase rad5 [Rhizoclosmatium sp. JEL0117]|nr:DNA helicase rad5 [Rhizoclosmatium sp. JEL0117]